MTINNEHSLIKGVDNKKGEHSTTLQARIKG